MTQETLNNNLDRISSIVTPELAEKLSKSSEPTLFFEEHVLEVLDIDITLSGSPKAYDRMQNHFEDICEDIMSR